MSIDIKVSLQDYEKLLLDDLCASSLFQDIIENGLPELCPATQILLLHSWSWTRKLAEDACLVYFSNDWVKNHNNSAAVAWPIIRRFWEYDREFYYNNHSRLALLLRDNPDLESRLIDTRDGQLPMLRFHLSHADNPYWKIVAVVALMIENQDETNRIRVSQLCRPASLEVIRNNYPVAVSEEFNDISLGDGTTGSESSDSEQQPAVQITSILGSFGMVPKFEIWSLVQMCCRVLRSSEDSSQKLHASLTDCGFFESHMESSSGFVNTNWQHTSNRFEFRHPSCFLEYIPWSDLRVDIRHPRRQRLVWRPERCAKFDHHLRTEEEVYRFCVNNNLKFPEFEHGDAIIFQQTPLKSSPIWGELHDYWIKWNDCAITQNADSGEWTLLETIPGKQFRNLYEENDQVGARRYFQRFVDNVRFGRINKVAEVFGLKEGIPQYDGFLEIIPFSEIHSINHTPLVGGNGLVYRAKWTCPQKINMAASKIREVALKTTRAAGLVEKRKFLDELDASLRALAAMSVRCIQFYGITKVPQDCRLFPPETLFMVFEWAELGSLLQYLDRQLTGTMMDWEIILDCIEDLAAGLDGLHSSKIIHRDIHPNNVLMRIRPTPRDATTTSAVETVLMDLGEGLAADKEQSLGRKYYGNVEYWAPEVAKHHQYSFASDVYSAGRLIAEMVHVRWKIVLQKTGEVDQSVPRDIAEITRMCMAEEPEDRPVSKNLLFHVQDVHQKLLRENSDGEYEMAFDDMTDGSLELIGTVESESDEDSDLDEDGIPI